MKVVKLLMEWVSKGVKVHYITGNHDEMLRKFVGFKLGSFSISNKLVLPIHGKKAWMFHGDVFDVTMQHAKWLARLGAIGYDMLILINQAVNFCYKKIGKGPLSMSKKIKNGVKSAVKFINNFERTAADIAIANHDLIINDFEPVSAWACKLRQKPCIALSHQAAVLSPHAPRPEKKDALGKLILTKYAPSTKQYGFHFKAYDENMFTPIIRQEIRNTTRTTGKHYTVYLPSYSEEKIMGVLSNIKNTYWEVFSKHGPTKFFWKNMTIRPIDNTAFIQSMASSKGVLCGAGFETPAEALHMQNKLLVIPMKGQYEQQCNAAALNEMGVPVIKSLKKKHLDNIRAWVDSDIKVDIFYPDITENIIDRLLEETLVSPTHEFL